jgi:hypothetical protein
LLCTSGVGLDAKIKKDIEANEEDTMWRDRKARLLDCIVQKISVMASRDMLEENFADFNVCDSMPARSVGSRHSQEGQYQQIRC